MAKKRTRNQNPKPFAPDEYPNSQKWARPPKQVKQHKAVVLPLSLSDPATFSLILLQFFILRLQSLSLYKSIQLLSSAMSSKILKEALIQLKEIQEEDSEALNASNNFVFPEENPTPIISDEEYFDGFSEFQSQIGLDQVKFQKFPIYLCMCKHALFLR